MPISEVRYTYDRKADYILVSHKSAEHLHRPSQHHRRKRTLHWHRLQRCPESPGRNLGWCWWLGLPVEYLILGRLVEQLVGLCDYQLTSLHILFQLHTNITTSCSAHNSSCVCGWISTLRHSKAIKWRSGTRVNQALKATTHHVHWCNPRIAVAKCRTSHRWGSWKKGINMLIISRFLAIQSLNCITHWCCQHWLFHNIVDYFCKILERHFDPRHSRRLSCKFHFCKFQLFHLK